VSGRTLPIADDGGQNNGAIDLAAPPLTRGSGGGLQDPLQISRNHNLSRPVRWSAVLDLSDMRGHLARKPGQIHIARPQDACGIRIFGQREQEMLQRDLRVGLRVGVTRGARQGRSQVLRHGNAPQIIDHHSPAPAPRQQTRSHKSARVAAPPSILFTIERDLPPAGKPPNRITAPDSHPTNTRL
jgi:hypothetical protein